MSFKLPSKPTRSMIPRQVLMRGSGNPAVGGRCPRGAARRLVPVPQPGTDSHPFPGEGSVGRPLRAPSPGPALGNRDRVPSALLATRPSLRDVCQGAGRGPAATSPCRAPTPSPPAGAPPAPFRPNMSRGGSEVTAAGSSVPFESARRSGHHRLFPAIRADMAAFAMELPPAGAEPMTLGSPTSPKQGTSAQFLPGFLMGDLPAPVTPQPRALYGPSVGVMETRSPLLTGGSPPQPVVPSHKDKGGAPPVRSIYDELSSPGLGSTPLSSRRTASFTLTQSPSVGILPSTPGAASSMFSPASIGQPKKTTLSPAQLDPFYTQGDSLTSEDQLDDTWVTVFGFPQASASYILLQFAQYGNILKHVMSNTGNWMHIRYQSKLQARKALSKDGRIFGESIMIGVKPCIDKSVMENFERSSTSSMSSIFTPPTKSAGTPTQSANNTARISTMRPLATAYKASTSDYQVVSDRQTPRKDESIVSKAMEYVFGW